MAEKSGKKAAQSVPVLNFQPEVSKDDHSGPPERNTLNVDTSTRFTTSSPAGLDTPSAPASPTSPSYVEYNQDTVSSFNDALSNYTAMRHISTDPSPTGSTTGLLNAPQQGGPPLTVGSSVMLEINRNSDSESEEESPEVDETLTHKRVKWMWRVVTALIISFVVMIPGIFTRTYSPSYGFVGWPLISWSAYIATTAWFYIVCQLIMSGLHTLIVAKYSTNVTVLYFVKDLKSISAFTLWALVNFLLWLLVPWSKLGDPTLNMQMDSSSRASLAFFQLWLISLGCILLLKLYYLKRTAFRFHRKAYFDRIQEALFAEYALNALLRPKHQLRMGKEDATLSEAVSDRASDYHEKARRSMSKYNVTEDSMDKLIKQVRKPYFFGPAGAGHRPSDVARMLWQNVKRKGATELTQKDFEVFLGHEDGARAFALFDNDHSGGVSRGEVRDRVRAIMRERRNLQLSLKDAKTIVAKLTTVFNFIAGMVAVLILFMVLNQIFKDIVWPMVSSMLGFSFIVASTASKLMESVIFILVMHPYDVGDRVFIDGDNLIVKKINFQDTEFVQADGKELYIANWTLYGKKIYNIRRSGPCVQELLIDTWYGVPNAALAQFNEKLIQFLKNHSPDFFPDATVCLTQTYQLKKCQLAVWVTHRDNFQDGGLRWRRWNKLAMFCKDTADQLGITYTPPVQDVNVANGAGESELRRRNGVTTESTAHTDAHTLSRM